MATYFKDSKLTEPVLTRRDPDGSGGGTQSILLGAVDDRIKVSFPNGMVSTSMQGGCYCENCNLCRNNCPGDAIATDHILTEGIKRWRIDMEKCYPYSQLHEAYCHICVDVCPYVFKENGDKDKRAMYTAYMKQRKEDGYRSPNRL